MGAGQLLVVTCYTNLRGQFIARELVHGQTIENKLVTRTVFVAAMFLTSLALAAFLGSPP